MAITAVTSGVVRNQTTTPSAEGSAAATLTPPARVDGTETPRVSMLAPANPLLALVPPRQGAIPGREVRFPRNLCQTPGRCSPEMARIFDAFNAAGAVDTQNLPQVMSGNTFWMNRMYNPEHAHHGGVILDRDANGQMTFNGRWSFFARTNPYSNATPEQAREWSQRRHAAVDRGDHLYVNATAPGASMPVEYWLRENKQTGDIYVIGFWGDGQFSVSEMRRNGQQ